MIGAKPWRPSDYVTGTDAVRQAIGDDLLRRRTLKTPRPVVMDNGVPGRLIAEDSSTNGFAVVDAPAGLTVIRKGGKPR